MKILREAYTAEEIEQRISDTKNIITALEDSLYILVSALDEYGDSDNAAIARDYVNRTHDMFVDFTNTFDSYELEEIEDGFEIEDDEIVEEAYFGPYDYPYEVRYTSTSGKDVLLGANKTLEGALDIAKRQVAHFVNQPFMDKKERMYAIASVVIVKNENGKRTQVHDPRLVKLRKDAQAKNQSSKVGEAFETKPWNAKYKGFKIRMDRDGSFYNIYDSENELVDHGFKSLADAKDAIDANKDNLFEDTIKTKSGKWVNKGDTGETHGEFKTKKEADAQRRAIFANWKK